MKVYLGEKGLDKSWQGEFIKEITCHHCDGKARIMFVGHEEGGSEEQYVCELHDNKGEGDYWPHDAIAVAVYLCKDCFEASIEINQA